MTLARGLILAFGVISTACAAVLATAGPGMPDLPRWGLAALAAASSWALANRDAWSTVGPPQPHG